MTTLDQRVPATDRQNRFLRAVLFVLIDVTVLALFVEYWDRIVIDSFTIALLTAILLQVALRRRSRSSTASPRSSASGADPARWS